MATIDFEILYIPDPNKGRPLFNGQVYVGNPGTDPTNPVNQKQLRVVEEDGSLINVSQPFSLSAGGVPVYNGSPVRLDVSGNYSIKILSSLGAQVYYISNAYDGVPIIVDDMSDYVSAEFASVAAMKNGSALNLPDIVDFADYVGRKVSTVVNNTTSNKGGAEYIIKTAAQATADGDVIDGNGNHWLLGGIDYAAVLQVGGGELDVMTCGVLTNGTDTYASLQAAWYFAQTIGADVFMPKGRYISNTQLIWPTQTNIRGVGGKIGSQTNPQTAIITTTLGSGVYQVISEAATGADYQNATFKDISLACEGAASDVARGLRMRGKGSKCLSCSFINNNYGVANGAVENWIMDNYFNSNSICIEDSGGECHIINNHGYPEDVAIVLRGSACLVLGNKFFGDGSNGEYGIEIWGSGNQVIGNVFDAFLEAAYYLNGKVTGLDCSHNYIIGNCAGTGVHGTSAIGAHVYMSATLSNVTHNEIYVSGYTNRPDRTPTYFYRMSAVVSFVIDHNHLGGSCRTSDFPAIGNVVSKSGGNVGSWNRVKISGYKTVREWFETVSNGDVVNHGIDATPTHISATPSTNTVYNVGYSTVTPTTFTVVGRDSAGALLSSQGINFRASREYA